LIHILGIETSQLSSHDFALHPVEHGPGLLRTAASVRPSPSCRSWLRDTGKTMGQATLDTGKTMKGSFQMFSADFHPKYNK